MNKFQVGDKVREIRHPDSIGHVYELHPTENKIRIQWLPDGLIGRRFSDADNYELVPSEVEALRQEIASLQEANRDLHAAAEARSEELGKARNFIRDFAEHIIPIDNFGARVDANRQARAYLEFKARAQVLLEQWEAAEVEAE